MKKKKRKTKKIVNHEKRKIWQPPIEQKVLS